uniref:Variant surface glycoprotein 1125.5671 n=1 Tax=Trypanosoma brucei TaxID=5691 RepID=A0A1J0RCP7_9TRYP|nr:variant surface glycoprotein 1125.5671 [Trypanosoma brucei]
MTNGVRYATSQKNLASFYAPHKTALETALTHANDAEVHEYYLQVFTEMFAPEEVPNLLPLLAAFSKNTKLSAADVTTGVKSAVDAATATAYLHGRIAEFLSIAADAAAAGNAAGCLINNDSANPITSKAPIADCKLEPTAARHSHPAGYEATPAKLFGPDGAHTAAGTVTHANKDCKLTKAHSTGGLIGTNDAANEIEYAAGYFKVTSNTQDTGRTELGEFQLGQKGTTPKVFHQARQAIHDYQQTALAQAGEHTLPSADDIKKN